MATLRPASTQIQMQLEPYGHLIRSTWYVDWDRVIRQLTAREAL